MKLLFVCSRNIWRSRTAEEIYKNTMSLQVKSAGTEPSARKRITEQDIRWADLIFVMEAKHKNRIKERFPNSFDNEKIIVMDIEDNYQFMDAELITEMKTIVEEYIA
jgi:protein-tyrosine phosphatase